MRLIFISLLILASSLTFGQLTVSLNSGLGTYQMKDLKSLQEDVRSSLPVNAQATSSFPAYWFYELSAKQQFENKSLVGGTFSYGSTGGRVSYSDYSGSLTYDQLASFYSIACSFGRGKTLQNGKLDIQGELRPGMTITNLRLSSNEIVGTTFQSSSTTTYKSLNFTLQPTASLQGKFGPVYLNAFAGYNFALIKGELQTTEKGVSSLSSNNQKIHADWSGIRVGGGITLKMPVKTPSELDRSSLGFGAGLDYGGFGINFLTYPLNNLGIFVGGGYALANFGCNGGIKLRSVGSSSKIQPYISAMYGYNAAIVVSNSDLYSKLFYGPSIGFGIDTQSQSRKYGYWTFGVLVPIRGSEVDNYINSLKAQGVQFKNSLLPLAISIGYRIILQ